MSRKMGNAHILTTLFPQPAHTERMLCSFNKLKRRFNQAFVGILYVYILCNGNNFCTEQ